MKWANNKDKNPFGDIEVWKNVLEQIDILRIKLMREKHIIISKDNYAYEIFCIRLGWKKFIKKIKWEKFLMGITIQFILTWFLRVYNIEQVWIMFLVLLVILWRG